MGKNDKIQDELKKTEYKILLEFDRVCRENNIKYSLGYGTLLGAVRHKGFIPWDDDIDIMMSFKEYLKFEKIAPSKLGEDYYFQSRLLNPKNYVYWNRIGLKNTTSIDLTMKKVKADWGICIDIFPMFKLSNNEKKRKKDIRKLRLLNLLSLKYYHKYTFKGASLKEKLKKVVHILLPDFINKYCVKRIYKYFSRYDDVDTQECTESLEFFNGKYVFSSKLFNSYTELEFEGKKFMAIKDWNEFLTARYGDYMTPPKDKSKHSDDDNVYIDFNHSYQDFWKK